MKELVLLVEPFREPCAPSPDQVIAHWNAWEVPEGRISLPERLYADLVAIRAEHMAWAARKCRPDSRPEQVCLCGGAPCSTSATPR